MSDRQVGVGGAAWMPLEVTTVTEDHGRDRSLVSMFTTRIPAEKPCFPVTVTVSGCTITLQVDGKWEGSIEGFRAAMAQGGSWGCDGYWRIMLWLLLRQMEADNGSS